MDRGTLKQGEPHPMAHPAAKAILNLSVAERATLLEALSSNAIEGNRVAEICAETLRRVINHAPVSDRYVLGLAWFIFHSGECITEKG